ncbi:MAG: SPOR domain-containing protein [Acidobacteria bacterium]|nr:SPOR domain-containing protein [Acidobacteriota bacterium]
MTASRDDGFREIQLSGKQLVFLFMAVTVVLVVTFLTGVLVGRGVRADRAEVAEAASYTDETAVPSDRPVGGSTTPTTDDDPRKAAPPEPVTDDGGESAGTKPAPVDDEPPVAVDRSPKSDKPAVDASATAKTAADQKGQPAAKVDNPVKPDAPKPVAPASPASAAPAPGSGYVVQVAAVNDRSEADAIVKRLTGKGYAAYVESPKGSTSVYRVRVGSFKSRRDAQQTAEKLKRNEKFKPWVTR